MSRLRAHGFVHGNAVADGRILLFFYFEHADAGIAMLIPEIHGQMEVARLRVSGRYLKKTGSPT